MQWETRDNHDRKDVDYTRWLSLENYRSMENSSGVYIFADADYQVKYIGKAGPRRMVDEIANAIYRDKDQGATLVKALYTNSDANAQSLETDLIHKYVPPNNIT